MSNINILFLSDLHFNNVNKETNHQKTLKNFLSTLRKIDSDWIPEIVIIAGDIGWYSKENEYIAAKKWLIELLDIFKLKPNQIFICPGNHDKDISKINGMPPQNYEQADEFLKIDKITNFENQFQEYINFCKDFGIASLDIGGIKNYLIGNVKYKFLSLYILNSSWFSKKDDKGKLWLGLPLLIALEEYENYKLIEEIDEKISISIIHHPREWYNQQELEYYKERPSPYNFIAKRSHLILSGHTHSEIIDEPDKVCNQSFLMKTGATYGGKYYRNNFSLIKINLNNNCATRRIFYSDPSQDLWFEKGPAKKYLLGRDLIQPSEKEIKDMIIQKEDKFETKTRINFTKFISPWVLPNEEIIINLVWDKDFEFDRIKITFPVEMELKNCLNLRNSTKGNGNLLFKKEDIKYTKNNNGFPNYFAAIFKYPSLNFPELKKFQDIKIHFEKEGKLINDEILLIAKIFRPKIVINSEAPKILLTDDKSNYDIPIELISKGFGLIKTNSKIEINTITLEFEENLTEQLKQLYLEDENKIKELKSKEIDKKEIQLFFEILNSTSTKEELKEKTKENEINPVLIIDFIDELMKFLKIRHMCQSVELSSPTCKIPKENFYEKIFKINYFIFYEDLLKNSYEPLKITFLVEDNRTEMQNSIIDFQIKIKNIIDENFEDIELEERN